MRSTIVAALGLAGLTNLCQAQLPDLPTVGSSWIAAGYPKLWYSSRNELTAGLYFEQIRPPGFDDWESPPPYRAKLSIDGEISTSGSKKFRAEARLPNLFPGWRMVVSFDALRRAQADYFGAGNDTEFDDGNVNDAQEHFYRADIHRRFVRGEIQRHVVSGLRVLAGFHVERWRFDTLPGPSVLAMEANPRLGSNTHEITGRVGLVFDTRDDEVSPARGVLIEALLGFADSTVAGDVSYTRATLSAAGYIPVNDELVVAGRIVAQSLSGSPPLGSLSHVEASDRAYSGVGGALSGRGYARDRFLGTDKLFSTVDFRYRLLGEVRALTISLLGFFDMGRVFHDEDLRLTFDDMHVSGGTGLVLAFGRAAILGFTVGVGEDGVRPQVHTKWTF